ncbi:MAG: MFS transporter [Oligoflexia bacterium]|nr:MFS transporter [Oligoflexia bacterium]
MLLLKALRNRPIALLWSGQALSAIGDEIYRVALIWFAVTLIGADTGYLAAGQCASLLALGLIGGKWADHWNHRKTMIYVDALRGLIVLLPVVLLPFLSHPLPLLWFVALTLSGLSAFFDPALQATLPSFSQDIETLQAATGLMGTTLRLARVIGPAIIGILSPFVSMIHFFTIDAFSFFTSAASIASLNRVSQIRHVRQKATPKPERQSFREAIVSGFRVAQASPGMMFVLLTKGILGGSWMLAFNLGLALLAHKIAPKDPRVFGLIIAFYGIGNVVSALILGNQRRHRPALILFAGYVWMGIGFILMALSPSLLLILLSSALAAIGGPLNDLPFFDLVQARFQIADIPKIFRLRMVLETGATLVCMLASPMLFRVLNVETVIVLCGLSMTVAGLLGLALCPLSRETLGLAADSLGGSS